MIDAENAPWIPQAPLNLHHKSVLSSKKIDGFWWWKIENAQKLNLLFVKKIICSTGPFEAISRKLYSPLGSASTGGVEKFPKKSGAKKMTLSERKDAVSLLNLGDCGILVLRQFPQLVGRFGEWKTYFLGIFGVLKPQQCWRKAMGLVTPNGRWKASGILPKLIWDAWSFTAFYR